MCFFPTPDFQQQAQLSILTQKTLPISWIPSGIAPHVGIRKITEGSGLEDATSGCFPQARGIMENLTWDQGSCVQPELKASVSKTHP